MDTLLEKIESIQVSREADIRIKEAFGEVAEILENIMENMTINDPLTYDKHTILNDESVCGIETGMTDEAVKDKTESDS